MEQKEKMPDANELKAANLKQKWNMVLKSPQGLDYLDRVVDFDEKLKKKYGSGTDDCLLFHTIAGSSLKREPIIFDFEGEDSIEQFILKCYE